MSKIEKRIDEFVGEIRWLQEQYLEESSTYENISWEASERVAKEIKDIVTFIEKEKERSYEEGKKKNFEEGRAGMLKEVYEKLATISAERTLGSTRGEVIREVKESFIREFCNDHNEKIRWLRGIALDEEDLLNGILEFFEEIKLNG